MVYVYVHDKIYVAIYLDGWRIYLRKLAKVRSTDPIWAWHKVIPLHYCLALLFVYCSVLCSCITVEMFLCRCVTAMRSSTSTRRSATCWEWRSRTPSPSTRTRAQEACSHCMYTMFHTCAHSQSIYNFNKYELKRCSKKECCKQCGYVKFKGTTKGSLIPS